jgi:polyhydroxyalkanoate synthesis regulator phasin
MIDMEQKIREKLEAEAAKWVEEELVRRMAYARDAIENQADVSTIMCGEATAKRHIRDASALAEEGIRQELEFEATGWVDEKMRERTRPMLEDHDLEGNLC